VYNAIYRAQLITKAAKWAQWLDAHFVTYEAGKRYAERNG
jgi:hypothetical protein